MTPVFATQLRFNSGAVTVIFSVATVWERSTAQVLPLGAGRPYRVDVQPDMQASTFVLSETKPPPSSSSRGDGHEPAVLSLNGQKAVGGIKRRRARESLLRQNEERVPSGTARSATLPELLGRDLSYDARGPFVARIVRDITTDPRADF